MQKLASAYDMSGRELSKGDTVSTLNGSMTGRISDIAEEEDTAFVCVRPVFQPYGRGTWHAADRVMYVASAQKKKS